MQFTSTFVVSVSDFGFIFLNLLREFTYVALALPYSPHFDFKQVFIWRDRSRASLLYNIASLLNALPVDSARRERLPSMRDVMFQLPSVTAADRVREWCRRGIVHRSTTVRRHFRDSRRLLAAASFGRPSSCVRERRASGVVFGCFSLAANRPHRETKISSQCWQLFVSRYCYRPIVRIYATSRAMAASRCSRPERWARTRDGRPYYHLRDRLSIGRRRVRRNGPIRLSYRAIALLELNSYFEFAATRRSCSTWTWHAISSGRTKQRVSRLSPFIERVDARVDIRL